MSNGVDGYRVKISRQGNAVDATVVLDVRIDGFHTNKYEVLRAWFWVDDCGRLDEIDRNVCKYVDDYEEKLISLVEKSFDDYDETGFDAETDQDAAYYACEYDTVMYSRSPRLRQKVVDQIVENDGHYEN